MSVGAVAHADVMRSIELFGTQVAPVVREEVARREASTAVATATAPVTTTADEDRADQPVSAA